MIMNSIFEKLQDYFNNTSRDEIEKAWEATSKFDDVNSPTVEVFIDSSSCFFSIEHELPDLNKENFVNNFKSPNFTSDFLFI